MTKLNSKSKKGKQPHPASYRHMLAQQHALASGQVAHLLTHRSMATVRHYLAQYRPEDASLLVSTLQREDETGKPAFQDGETKLTPLVFSLG